MSGDLKMGSDDRNGYPKKMENCDENIENVQTKPAGFGQKFKRHCERFWWLHLFIFCAVVLILALCLVYVGMPRIVQSLVNKSSLKIYELQFLNPTPDSVTLNQSAQLHNPSTFTPTLDAFAAGVFVLTNGIYAPTPFASINFPVIHALHPSTNVTTFNEVLNITNQDELTQYCIQIILNENVTTALVGDTKLHEGALPVTNIEYNTTTTYASLNGLKGFNTVDLKINLTSKAGQPNLRGTATLPNPTVLTVELGNVTLELTTAKEGVVGMATINDLTVRPGDNSYLMSAVVDETKILSSEDAKTGLVEMFATGNSSTYNGQRIPYYEAALLSNKLTLSLNITEILANSA